MARPLTTQPKTYDESKLLAMTAPFTVRVEKLRGNARTPIPMPEGEDPTVPAGTGWGIEDVRGIEQWLVTEWSGGGVYEITITDSSQPTPQQLKWAPFYDPKLYPERTPPPLEQAASGAAPPPPSNVTPLYPQPQQGHYNMTAFPRGLPQYPFQQPQYAQQPYGFQAPMPNPPVPGSMGWAPWQQEVERREQLQKDRERDQELQRERERREKLERETLDARHKAELERERQANESRFTNVQNQMQQLSTMITQLASSIKEAGTSSRVAPEIEQMREQNRQTEARLERERLEREAERRESTTREAIKSMQDSMRQQIEMLQRQFDDRTRALEAAAKDGKPDQFLMVWQQSQREMMELSKELSRNQASQMASMQSFMMNPRDMLSLAKESTSTFEQAIDKSNNFYGRMIETQQKMTENLLAMTPQSNGVVEIIGNGVDKLGGLAERYLGGKQMEQQLNAQVAVQTAEVQARAWADAQRPAAQAAAAAPATPAQAAQANGLSGTPVPPAAEPTKRPKKAKAANDEEPKPPVADPMKKRFGKTDAEWFGIVMPQINQLRGQAHAFIQSLIKKDFDKKGNPKGWGPEQTAMTIAQAIAYVQQNQIPVPAMMELMFQNRFADFIDVVLPDPVVTEQYRIDVTQNLLGIARKAQGMDPTPEPGDDKSTGEDVDDDDDDDDDDDGDDNEHEEIEASSDDADEDADAGEDANTDKAHDGKATPPPKSNGNAGVVPLRRA